MATRKSENDYKWEKDNCIRINLKIRNDSGLVEIIDKVRVGTNDSRNSYIIAAIREKLIRDGYLPSENKEDSLAFRMRDMAKDYGFEIGEIVTMALHEREIYERESGASHITATQAVLELLDIYEKSMNRSEQSE